MRDLRLLLLNQSANGKPPEFSRQGGVQHLSQCVRPCRRTVLAQEETPRGQSSVPMLGMRPGLLPALRPRTAQENPHQSTQVVPAVRRLSQVVQAQGSSIPAQEHPHSRGAIQMLGVHQDLLQSCRPGRAHGNPHQQEENSRRKDSEDVRLQGRSPMPIL